VDLVVVCLGSSPKTPIVDFNRAGKSMLVGPSGGTTFSKKGVVDVPSAGLSVSGFLPNINGDGVVVVVGLSVSGFLPNINGDGVVVVVGLSVSGFLPNINGDGVVVVAGLTVSEGVVVAALNGVKENAGFLAAELVSSSSFFGSSAG